MKNPPTKKVSKKKRTKRVKTGKYHDAQTGMYVTKKRAKRSPSRVIAETRVIQEEKPTLSTEETPTIDGTTKN